MCMAHTDFIFSIASLFYTITHWCSAHKYSHLINDELYFDEISVHRKLLSTALKFSV